MCDGSALKKRSDMLLGRIKKKLLWLSVSVAAIEIAGKKMYRISWKSFTAHVLYFSKCHIILLPFLAHTLKPSLFGSCAPNFHTHFQLSPNKLRGGGHLSACWWLTVTARRRWSQTLEPQPKALSVVDGAGGGVLRSCAHPPCNCDAYRRRFSLLESSCLMIDL